PRGRVAAGRPIQPLRVTHPLLPPKLSARRIHLGPGHGRRCALAAVLVLIGAVAAAGCLPAPPPPPPPPPPLSPMTIGVTHSVAVRQTTFVDTTRATSPFGLYPGSSSRTLPTTIWYPSDGGGPFPLVVFAHGFGVTPTYYASLLPRIAAAGYVVA